MDRPINYYSLSFQERKEVRRKELGWKEKLCGACNGSGYYDHNGSPKCGACNGTGKEKYKPNE